MVSYSISCRYVFVLCISLYAMFIAPSEQEMHQVEGPEDVYLFKGQFVACKTPTRNHLIFGHISEHPFLIDKRSHEYATGHDFKRVLNSPESPGEEWLLTEKFIKEKQPLSLRPMTRPEKEVLVSGLLHGIHSKHRKSPRTTAQNKLYMENMPAESAVALLLMGRRPHLQEESSFRDMDIKTAISLLRCGQDETRIGFNLAHRDKQKEKDCEQKKS